MTSVTDPVSEGCEPGDEGVGEEKVGNGSGTDCPLG